MKNYGQYNMVQHQTPMAGLRLSKDNDPFDPKNEAVPIKFETASFLGSIVLI